MHVRKHRTLKENIAWLTSHWSDAMNNFTAFPNSLNRRPEMEHNMCGRRAAIVNRHCGDDLALRLVLKDGDNEAEIEPPTNHLQRARRRHALVY